MEGWRDHYLDRRGCEQGELVKVGCWQCPLDTQGEMSSSSRYRCLEVRAEVRAGNVNLGNVSKGMAVKVIEQDELNHRMRRK